MQNNVRKSLASALICVSFAAILLVCYFVFSEKSPSPTELPDLPDSGIATSEKDGVTYVGNGFEISEYTASVSRGETAKIAVTANTRTELEISVYYASGKSSATVFSPKTANLGRDAVWEWSVPKNSSGERIRAVIRSDNTCATLFIDVK